MTKIMQGDAYNIPLIIKVGDISLTPNELTEVEIVIDTINKKYSTGDITFTEDRWLFPLTQEETFALPCKRIDAQVRVKFTDDVVKGVTIPNVLSVYSISKEVI